MFQLAIGRVLLIAWSVVFCRALMASQICVVVNDPDGLPVPAAQIIVFNLSTSVNYSGQSDSKGHACFERIPEGIYSVESGAPGFLNVRYYPVHATPALRIDLEFRLPFGEGSEGGVGAEAVLSGTLRRGNSPIPFASICAMDEEAKKTIRCVESNDTGEYAILLHPGSYLIEIDPRSSGQVRPLFIPSNRGPVDRYQLKIVIPSSGTYRNRLTIPE